MFTLFISCSKDTAVPEQISVGNSVRMRVTTPDIYLGEVDEGFSYGESCKLDMDGDGENEIRIYIVQLGDYHNPAYGSNVECLSPEVTIAVEQVTDTVYTISELLADQIFFSRTCSTTSDIADLDYINTYFLPLQFYEGDSIIRNLAWESGDFIMTEEPRSYNDLTGELSTYTNEYCHELPIGEEFYIGIKITRVDTIRLGWIKLEIPDYDQVRILETALQR